uniref:Uncharacterized protein n=1 Tax=Panstrongylus lignarius TaxID=156445 RepID=A0A224Y285_9HEMI
MVQIPSREYYPVISALVRIYFMALTTVMCAFISIPNSSALKIASCIAKSFFLAPYKVHPTVSISCQYLLQFLYYIFQSFSRSRIILVFR